MTRRFEDLVEAEVRRRMAERLSSAGLSEGRLSHEVLFLLPEEFVREYTELFFRALKEDTAGMLGKVGGDEGQIKKGIGRRRDKFTREKPKKGEEKGKLRDGNAQGARGGEKGYKDHWIIKDDVAFEAKRRVDRKLRRIVQAAMRDARMHDDESPIIEETSSARDQSGRFVRRSET